METKQYRTNAVIDNEIELMMKKNARFDNLKKGDMVKVPPYGRKVRIVEKYPHMFLAMHQNGYRVCFTRGDYITALGLSGRKVVREDD